MSRGNSADLAELYRQWRGHHPQIEPMLENRGLSESRGCHVTGPGAAPGFLSIFPSPKSLQNVIAQFSALGIVCPFLVIPCIDALATFA